MKVELSDYFKELGYVAGYLIKDRKGRMDIHLIKERKRNGKRKCISYAKYLWMSHNKQEVPEGYQVDHINNNFKDDRIENLQLLTQKENNLKSKRNKRIVILKCPVCNKEFEYEVRNLSTHKNPCCSRKCGGIKSHW